MKRPPATLRFQAALDLRHVGVDDRREKQRHELRKEQAAHDDEPERLAGLAARAVAQRDRNGAQALTAGVSGES